MPTNIRDLRIDVTGIARVGQHHVDRLARHILQDGDIIYSRRGDVEKCALITPDESGWLCGTGCLLVRIKGINPRYLAYALSLPATRAWIAQHAIGATMPNLNTDILREVPISIPDRETQDAIAATLGALDDKIDSNRRARTRARELGSALLATATTSATSRMTSLGSVTASITRGVTPQYADDDQNAPLVLNQKCIRDGWVTTSAARRMRDKPVADEKRVAGGDILVCSTGTGTLGRVGRWHSGTVFADSHVSIVKPQPHAAQPTVLAFCLLQREADIEALATGSTGQTELNPSRLASLILTLPNEAEQRRLEPVLLDLEDKANSLLSEELALSTLRDTLLSELLGNHLVASQGNSR
ncbi:MAG: restriction endonuclease subunit S [Propionibacteriaceae bacterium]|nr:restriction endonuclease subunit S [Propionibacteriaceae bacterium]